MKISEKRSTKQKIVISILFGLMGFYLNFHAVNLLEYATFDVSMLYGLLFPLLISLFWGWKFGLISALAGGCQSMWWLWTEDGYGMIYSVPVFTLWIVWHGWWANKRKNNSWNWLRSMYVVELLFRIIIEIGFFTIFRWLVSQNPPFWDSSITNNHVSTEWLFFVARKHIITAYILLLISDVLMHMKFIRKIFKPEEHLDDNNTTYVISISIVVGFIIWMIHSLFDYYFMNLENLNFIEIAFTKIPPTSSFARVLILITSALIGLLLSRLYLIIKTKSDAVLAAEQRYHQLIDISFDLILTLNENGEITYANRAVNKYLKNRNIIGANFFEMLAPDFRSNAQESFGHGMLNEHMQVFELQFDYFDEMKSYFEACGSTIYDKENKPSGTVVILRDISERKHNEGILKKAEKDWRNSINSMDEVFLLLDNDHNILNINQRGLEILEMNREEVVGKKCYSVIYDRTMPDALCPAKISKQNDSPSSSVYYAGNLDRYLSLRCSPVYDADNKIVNFVIIMDDVSSRVKVEKGLKQYREDLERKIKEKDQLIEENEKELRYNIKLFEQREYRIKELREQVKTLKKELEDKF